MRRLRSPHALLLAASLALGACVAPAGTAPGPSTGASSRPGPLASATPRLGLGSPRPVLPTDAARAFVGQVRLVPDTDLTPLGDLAGIAVRNADGRLVSNNGSNIISDNGGSFVGKVRSLMAPAPASGRAELPLMGAVVSVHDATGRPLVGADGKPIEAVTDAAGAYEIRASLPAESLVLQVRLWTGGELLALAPKAPEAAGEGRTVAIDTATSLGAALVLERFVKGQAGVLEKLPAPEAERLRRDLDAAWWRAPEAPTYERAALAARAEALRQADPALDETIQAIERLFVGQPELGEGALATAVALAGPTRTLPEAGGGLVVAEAATGRLRRIGADGRMGVWFDQAAGQVRRAFPGLGDLEREAGGTLLVSSPGEGVVHRLDAQGGVTTAAALAGFTPGALAAGPDGTVFVAEALPAVGQAPRVLAFAAGGGSREVAPTAAWAGSEVIGLARGADGTLWALTRRRGDGAGALHRLPAGAAAWTQVASPAGLTASADLLAEPDGAVLVGEAADRRVSRYAADGTRTTVFAGAPLSRPAGLARAADGALLITDVGAGLVLALDAAGGTPRVVAGVAAGAAMAGDAISLSAPGALAIDDTGALLFVDGGTHALKRLVGGRVETVAGGGAGFVEDGEPAATARFQGLTALAARGGTTWFAERQPQRLRRLGPDGKVVTAAGGGEPGRFEAVGGLRPAADAPARDVLGLALDPQGRPVWSSIAHHQLRRVEADGQVRLLAGDPRNREGDAVDGAAIADAQFRAPTALAYGPDGALYVADSRNLQVRRIANPDAPGAVVEAFLGLPRAEAMEKLKDPVRPDAEGVDRRAATLAPPHAMCFDAAGNLYVAELGSANLAMLAVLGFGDADPALAGLGTWPARIRKVAPDGKVTTVAGPGGKHLTAASGPDALVFPSGLAIDPQGRLVIADLGANLIRFLPAGSF